MFIATRGGNIKVVQTLMQFSADSTIKVNEKTSLDLARSLNYPQIVSLLSGKLIYYLFRYKFTKENFTGDKIEISSTYQTRKRYQRHMTPNTPSMSAAGRAHASMQFTMEDLELLRKMESKGEDAHLWFARGASPAKRSNMISLGSSRSQDGSIN